MNVESLGKANEIRNKFRELENYQKEIKLRIKSVYVNTEYMSVIRDDLTKEIESVISKNISHKKLILELEFEKL